MFQVHQALLISITGLALSAAAGAQTPDRATDAASSSPESASSPHQRSVTQGAIEKNMTPISPQAFVGKAGQDGMTEVALAKLALDRSKSDGIRKFATHMQQDHSSANSELTKIASKKGISAPQKLDSEHQGKLDALKAKQGSDFDAAYAAEMKDAHTKAIRLFKQGSASGDPDIAAFASKTLPTLQEHKQMADGLKSQMKTASSGTTASE